MSDDWWHRPPGQEDTNDLEQDPAGFMDPQDYESLIEAICGDLHADGSGRPQGSEPGISEPITSADRNADAGGIPASSDSTGDEDDFLNLFDHDSPIDDMAAERSANVDGRAKMKMQRGRADQSAAHRFRRRRANDLSGPIQTAMRNLRGRLLTRPGRSGQQPRTTIGSRLVNQDALTPAVPCRQEAKVSNPLRDWAKKNLGKKLYKAKARLFEELFQEE